MNVSFKRQTLLGLILGSTITFYRIHGLTIFDRSRRLQPFGLELSPGELQGLGQQVKASHVEEKLLESAVVGRVHIDAANVARSALGPSGGRVGDGRQRGGLVPGHVDDGVHEEQDETKLGENLVVFRGHERLLGQLRGRGRGQGRPEDGRDLVLLVATAGVAPTKESSFVERRLTVVQDDVSSGDQLKV